jgi:hypothetical protein
MGKMHEKDSFLLAIQSSDLLYGSPAANYCPIGNSADLMPAYLGQLMPIRELGCNSARSRDFDVPNTVWDLVEHNPPSEPREPENRSTSQFPRGKRKPQNLPCPVLCAWVGSSVQVTTQTKDNLCNGSLSNVLYLNLNLNLNLNLGGPLSR